MASIIDRPSHVELTKTQPRDPSLHRVIVSAVDETAYNVRLIRLRHASGKIPFKFRPGQWVDLHIPNIRQIGGFSITSTPGDAQQFGFVELAIQRAPQNPPAAWLWQPKQDLHDQMIELRIGGSFFWPPLHLHPASVNKVLLIAGGVGINPLISILSHLHQQPSRLPPQIEVLYTHRKPPRTNTAQASSLSSILFLHRLIRLFSSPPFNGPSKAYRSTLFITPSSDEHIDRQDLGNNNSLETGPVNTLFRRLTTQDLASAMGADIEKRKGVVTYVCGPPAMTDWVTSEIGNLEGVDSRRILYEKWW